jgi:hypothetical protein
LLSCLSFVENLTGNTAEIQLRHQQLLGSVPGANCREISPNFVWQGVGQPPDSNMHTTYRTLGLGKSLASVADIYQ